MTKNGRRSENRQEIKDLEKCGKMSENLDRSRKILGNKSPGREI